MLKITKASEPITVSQIVVCLYAPPGIGKTSMGFTAAKPLLLDFDKGSYRSKNRRDIVQVDKWAEVTAITREDLAPYSTLIVDTAGRALDCLTIDIIAENPKMGRGGGLTLPGYGELKTKFAAWANLIHSFGLDIVLIAHSDEKQRGDDLIERLDIQGGSKNEIYKTADVMGRIYLSGGRRTLNLSPTDTAFGKNPAQLPVLEVPDYATAPDFLATVIAQTKAALNAMTEEQTKAATALSAWAETIGKAVTVEDFNGLIEPAKAADESVRDNMKRALVKVAKDRGFAFDVKAVTFTGPPAAKADHPCAVCEKPVEGSASLTPPISHGACHSEQKPAEAPASREPGDDSEDEEANRKAAAPSEAEMAAAAETGLALAPSTSALKVRGKAAR